MVAQKCCGCCCRLTTAFAILINVTKIAISASTWYFDTVTKAQASLCKRTDFQEPSLTAQEIFILMALSSDFVCANLQTHQSIRFWRENHTNRHFRQHKRFCTVTKAKVILCKCADSPEPSLHAQNGIWLPFKLPHENFELWRRLRLDQANVQSLQSHHCSHEWHPKIVGEYDREISQSQTADKPMALRGIATQSRDTRKTN